MRSFKAFCLLAAVTQSYAIQIPGQQTQPVNMVLKKDSGVGQMIVDMDMGFPKLQTVKCPHAAGQEYIGFNDTMWGGRERKDVPYCHGMLKQAEASGECLIYNFGVGSNDPFLHHVAENYPKCEIFAFDPTVSEERWVDKGGAAGFFGPNVKFFSWGLYGGEGPRTLEWVHSRYQNAKHRAHGLVKGDLYTLQEIMEKLGHKDRRISLFRSDCEGCEWDWIDKAMKDHPDVFSKMDQMFTEIHFAQTLRFDSKALSKAPSFHKMVNDNFAVQYVHSNKGFNKDRFQLPDALKSIGVEPEACCREFLLINKEKQPKWWSKVNKEVSFKRQSDIGREREEKFAAGLKAEAEFRALPPKTKK